MDEAGQSYFQMCICDAHPFTDTVISQQLSRVDSHINEERRFGLGPDLLRTLCLGGTELRFESRAVSPHRPLLLLSPGWKPPTQGKGREA